MKQAHILPLHQSFADLHLRKNIDFYQNLCCGSRLFSLYRRQTITLDKTVRLSEISSDCWNSSVLHGQKCLTLSQSHSVSVTPLNRNGSISLFTHSLCRLHWANDTYSTLTLISCFALVCSLWSSLPQLIYPFHLFSISVFFIFYLFSLDPFSFFCSEVIRSWAGNGTWRRW